MDLNVRAFRIVQQATSEESSSSKQNKLALREGCLVGGPSRARSVSKERRIEIAKKSEA